MHEIVGGILSSAAFSRSFCLAPSLFLVFSLSLSPCILLPGTGGGSTAGFERAENMERERERERESK
jgi:hypothetical protein